MYDFIEEQEEETEDFPQPDNPYLALPVLKWPGPDNWQDQAKCKGMATLKFFDRWSVDKLGHLCAECPVRLTCLEFAIRNDLPNGLYGGLNGVQRIGMTVEDIQVG